MRCAPVSFEPGTEPIQHFLRPTLHLRYVFDESKFSRFGPKEHVLRHGQVGSNCQLLVNYPDTRGSRFVRRMKMHRFPIEKHLAAVWAVCTRKDLHQSAFASTV